MSKIDKKQLCNEIDLFLQAHKVLKDQQPIWRDNGRPDELDARWPIIESGGVSRAELAFRYNRISTGQPSVTLIYRKKAVCRVDIKANDESDGNPPQARSLGLPARVYGPHVHKWEHNKQYVLESLRPDEWDIPIKEEISNSTQKIPHILAYICEECNIDFTPEQRELNPPMREDLFR